MPTPKAGYYLKDGTRVPGVTTVISPYGDSGGLVHWAWALGMQGKDYREERDNAADAGTMAHGAVEAWVHNQTFEFTGPDDVCKKARSSFGAFLEWAQQSQLKVTHTEVGLVSEKYKFGGTLDAILVSNRRAMGDWKTSGRVYPKNLIQLAAYGKLWEEHNPNEPIEGGFHLLRFDKEFGDFHQHWWGDLGRAWDAFLHLRELYEIDKELKKRAA